MTNQSNGLAKTVTRMDVLSVMMEHQGDSIDRLVQWNYNPNGRPEDALAVGGYGDADWLYVEHEVSPDCDSYVADGSLWTIWTADWVYFPMQGDGRETIGSVPRNPQGNITFIKWQTAGEINDN